MKIESSSANLMIFSVAFFWGTGFIFTKILLDLGLSGSLIILFRGLIYLLIVVIIFNKKLLHITKKEYTVGFIGGIFNGLGYLFQSLGMEFTSTSICAFLTTSNVVFVPIFATLLFRRKLQPKIILGVIVCFIGTIVISNFSLKNFVIGKGELFSLCGAVFFAFSVAYLGNRQEGTRPETITFMMAATMALCGLVRFALLDKFVMPNIDYAKVILPLLYIGCICTFLCSTVQVVAQKFTSETIAVILMSLEGVFGSMLAIIIGYDKPTTNLLIGGALIVAAAMICSLNFRKSSIHPHQTPK